MGPSVVMMENYCLVSGHIFRAFFQVVQMRSLHQKWPIKFIILFWMSRKWMYVKYLKSYPSQLSEWTIFSIHICVWERSVQDGCRHCSQSTENAFVWPLRSKISHILTPILKSFCVDLWRWMKHGSTKILQNRITDQNSRLNLAKVH